MANPVETELVDPIIARLDAACPALKGRVKGAGTLAAIKDRIQNFPTAYVVPESERARPNDFGSQKHRQLITVSFSIILGVKGSQSGKNSVDPERVPLQQIKHALMGWMHPMATHATNYEGSRLFAFETPILWRGLTFSFRLHEEGPTA